MSRGTTHDRHHGQQGAAETTMSPRDGPMLRAARAGVKAQYRKRRDVAGGSPYNGPMQPRSGARSGGQVRAEVARRAVAANPCPKFHDRVRPADRPPLRPSRPRGIRLRARRQRPGRFPVHARHPPHRLPGQAVDDEAVRGVRDAGGDQPPLQGAAAQTAAPGSAWPSTCRR